MDLNKLIGYSQGGTHTVDMEGVIHAVPAYENSNLRPSSTDLRRQSDKPPASNSPSNEKERSSTSRSFWNTVMDFPPSSVSSASTPRTAVTNASFQLSDVPPSTSSNTNLTINTEREMVNSDRAESEEKP